MCDYALLAGRRVIYRLHRPSGVHLINWVSSLLFSLSLEKALCPSTFLILATIQMPKPIVLVLSWVLCLGIWCYYGSWLIVIYYILGNASEDPRLRHWFNIPVGIPSCIPFNLLKKNLAKSIDAFLMLVNLRLGVYLL